MRAGLRLKGGVLYHVNLHITQTSVKKPPLVHLPLIYHEAIQKICPLHFSVGHQIYRFCRHADIASSWIFGMESSAVHKCGHAEPTYGRDYGHKRPQVKIRFRHIVTDD
ncbi:hypothetical protein Syun_012343 [Stephania yunnanensis]|uniref:Uncharacterized protein n=1 Tax=Stephania yunnanensis TaxID=152371 RepID=A0AAP0PF82_9MAGN